MRIFARSPPGTEPDASGYQGFSDLDREIGRGVWDCELSTIDSAFLFADLRASAAYFDRDDTVPTPCSSRDIDCFENSR